MCCRFSNNVNEKGKFELGSLGDFLIWGKLKTGVILNTVNPEEERAGFVYPLYCGSVKDDLADV